jgi:transcriptional regulator with XRE-family HTH domain
VLNPATNSKHESDAAQSLISQAELAERLGWDQTTVSHIETGSKRVTAIELIELSEVLGFDLCEAILRIAKVRD